MQDFQLSLWFYVCLRATMHYHADNELNLWNWKLLQQMFSFIRIAMAMVSHHININLN